MSWIDVDADTIYLYYRYDEKFKEIVKELGFLWDKTKKAWWMKSFHISYDIVNELRSFFPGHEIKKLISAIKDKKEKIRESRKVYADIDIPVPKGLELYPYQKAGVEFLLKRKHVLLADEMGLGKTIQVIAYLNLVKTYPVVVICPASVKYNWERELKKWLVDKRDILVLEGKKAEVKPADIIILNYDIASAYVEKLSEINPKILVLDEVHYVKNYKAQRTKAVMSLQADKIIALSGTPMLNRPVELWPILKKTGVFYSFRKFTEKYCDRKKTEYGVDVSGASNLDNLAAVLRSSIMLRREKKDVLRDLPSKIRTIIPLGRSSRMKELEENVKSVILGLSALHQRKEHLKQMGRLTADELAKIMEEKSKYMKNMEEYRIAVAKEKLPYINEFVRNALSQTDEKIIVFSYHRSIHSELCRMFADLGVVAILGGDSPAKRQEAVDRFQKDDNIRVFVGSIRATSEGINLTRSSRVVFAEYDWTPARMIQAEDRAHRIGQKNIVYSYWFTLSGSIDERIITKLVEKMKLIGQTMMDKSEEEFLILEIAKEISDGINFEMLL